MKLPTIFFFYSSEVLASVFLRSGFTAGGKVNVGDGRLGGRRREEVSLEERVRVWGGRVDDEGVWVD